MMLASLFKILIHFFKQLKELNRHTLGIRAGQFKCKIMTQEFDEHSNETRFQICKQGSTKFITLTAKHFAFNKKLLQYLTQEDAYLVGFTLASELAAKEKQAMQALKLNNGCRP